MTSTTPTERALRILAVLQAGRCLGADDLAARLDVDPRTIRRDIARLRELGYRIDADAGPGGGYRLSPAERLPPLQLDPMQAEAVAVGLHLVAAQGLDPLAGEALRALGLLGRLLPPEAASRVARIATATSVSPDVASPLDASVLLGLAEAITGMRRVRFGYLGRSGEPTDRNVEPYRVVRFAARWYLLAFDRDRDDWRTFRLDRMSQLHLTTFTFHGREAPDAVEYVRRSVQLAGSVATARVRMRAPADRVRERVARTAGDVVPISDDECEVALGLDHARWAAPYLVATGIEIVSATPPEVAEALRELGQRLARVVDG